MSMSNIVGQAEKEFEVYQQYVPKGNADLGKDAFLTLLVTQLQNQDPLNPMEDKEFTAQLAQFSSLEQLTNISDGIENMGENANRQEMLSAVSFIDKEIMAKGYQLSKSDEKINTVYFELSKSAASCYVNIFDNNGAIVNTVKLGALQAGAYQVNWDGTDYDGNEMPNGTYQVAMAAEGTDGKAVLVDTHVSGVVAGVQLGSDGSYVLRLEDGREVEFANIKEISSSSSKVSDSGEAGSDEDAGTGGEAETGGEEA